jgi:hypothetical protein
MTRQLDIEQLLDIWLDDGPTDTADAVFDMTVSRIYRQRQRPAWRLLWKDAYMNGTLRLAVAIAAVVLAVGTVAVVLRQPTTNIGAPASPSPSPTPDPTPAVSPGASLLTYVWPGPLQAGRYQTSLVWDVPFQFEFTVPDGWEGYDIEVSRPDAPGLSVEFVLVDNVFGEPCAGTPATPAAGPSVDELTQVLATLPDLDVSDPSPIQFDRSTQGVELTYALGADAACGPGAYALWQLTAERFKPGVANGGDAKNLTAAEGRMKILDVAGQRVVLRATWDSSATPAQRAEVDEIFGSIGIARPGATPPPGPATP